MVAGVEAAMAVCGASGSIGAGEAETATLAPGGGGSPGPASGSPGPPSGEAQASREM